MFDTHTHGESLGFKAHAFPVQQFVNITGRMSRSQHHGRTFDERRAAPYAPPPAAFDFEVRHPAVENESPAGIEDRLPDALHDTRQFVGADMRMGLVKDFGRRAVEDERLQRLVIVAALLAARKELPVGEGPRTAFAESVVRIGIDVAVAVDLRDIDLAGRDVAAPLQNHGPQAQLDQPQSGEKARRTRPDDHHFGPPRDRRIVEMHGRGPGFAVCIYLQRQVHLGLPLPGVDRPFDDPHQSDILLRHAQTPCGERRVILRIGSLPGCQDECDILRHNRVKLSTKVNKKAL